MYYCSYCLKAKAPAVYRFVCPDGRSYVGSGLDIRKREERGIARKNGRLTKAFKKHPAETWRFEILEALPPACAKGDLRAAEQRHIDRLRTYRESKGFNMFPAVWAGNGPAQKAGRRHKAKMMREVRQRMMRAVQQSELCVKVNGEKR